MTKSRIFWAVAVLAALIVTVRPVNVAAQALAAKADAGSGFAAEPLHIVFSELPAATFPGKITEAPEPQTGYTPSQWKAIKAHAAIAPAVALPLVNRVTAPPSRSGGAFTPGASIDVLGANEDLACSALTPSDMGLAVSASYIVQVTNACVEIYNKNGGQLSGYPVTLSSFFGYAAGTFTYDPRALYDWQTGRWIVTSATKFSNSGNINVAVSESSNPTGGWHVYQIEFGGAGQWGDFPTVGQTDEGDNDNGLITICANIFTISGNSFVTAQCDYLNKFEMYQGHSFSFNDNFNFNVGGTLSDTLQPANQENPYEKPRAQFLVSSYNFTYGCGSSSGGCNGLLIWAISNAIPNAGSPGWGSAGIAISTPSNYNFPADADQPGSLNSIDTDDERISASVPYSGGFLYPVINVANGGTVATLGWKVAVYLNDNGGGCTGGFECPTIDSHTAVVQEFCDYCGSGHSNDGYYGSIGVTPEGNWTMTANYSSESLYPGTFMTSNRVTWPTPFHDSGEFICQAQNSYSQGRWGDYTASAADVEAKGSNTIFPAVWSSGMYVMSDHDWGTCIAESGYNQPTDN